MSNFDRAVEHVISEEGGYVNDPKDPGGETKYGISKRAYPNLDIKNLTIGDAKAIYKADYWDVLPMDDLPDPVAFALLDCAVNSGPVQAAKLLQRACLVKEDGILGPISTTAAHRNGALERFMAKRLQFMMGLKNWEHCKNGWTERLFRVTRAA